MIKKELLDIWKSAKSRLIAVAFLLIVGVDFAEKVYWQYQDFWEHPEAYPEGLTGIYHPSMAGFLSGGGGLDHNCQYLLGKRQILKRSYTELPQPFASWSNSL